MSNFRPSNEVLEKWTSTRKSQKKLGDNFFHPRIFSTVDYKIDRNWVYLAVFIELLSLFIAILFTGFNPWIIAGAFVAVLLDFVCAVRLHKGQKHINKFQCRLELVMYEGRVGLGNPSDFKDQKETSERAIGLLQRKKIPFIIAILLIASVKAFFGFLALVPYGIISFIVPPLFFLAAYIHIKHTGYFLSERSFRKAFNDEQSKFHWEDANNKLKGSKYYIDKFTPTPIENIPEKIEEELEEAYTNLPQNSTIAQTPKPGMTAADIILYGKNNLHNISYNTALKKYLIFNWGPIKDEDLFQLIEESGGSNALKSFFGYQGLKAQKFEEPTLID